MTLLDPQSGRTLEGARPLPLDRDQELPDGAGPVIELGGGRDEDAPTGQGGGPGPVEPGLEHGADPGFARRMVEGGADGPVAEALDGGAEHLQLQRLLGVEVGEQAALGQADPVGQATDGQVLEADAAGDPEAGVEDGLPGGLALRGHEPAVGVAWPIIRTFVLFRNAP